MVFDDEIALPPDCTLGGAFGYYLSPRYSDQCGFERRPHIIVASSLRRYPSGTPTPARTLAVLLAHEGWHLREDMVFGRPSLDPAACLGNEMNAFSSGARYWSAIWPASRYPGGMPNPQNDLERFSNELLRAYRTEDPSVVKEVIEPILDFYLQRECRVTRPMADQGTGGSAILPSSTR